MKINAYLPKIPELPEDPIGMRWDSVTLNDSHFSITSTEGSSMEEMLATKHQIQIEYPKAPEPIYLVDLNDAKPAAPLVKVKKTGCIAWLKSCFSAQSNVVGT